MIFICRFLVLFLSISFVISCSAQKGLVTPQDLLENDPSFFAYAKSEKEASKALNLAALSADPESDYRYKVVKKILDDLIMARGDKKITGAKTCH